MALDCLAVMLAVVATLLLAGAGEAGAGCSLSDLPALAGQHWECEGGAGGGAGLGARCSLQCAMDRVLERVARAVCTPLGWRPRLRCHTATGGSSLIQSLTYRLVSDVVGHPQPRHGSAQLPAEPLPEPDGQPGRAGQLGLQCGQHYQLPQHQARPGLQTKL